MCYTGPVRRQLKWTLLAVGGVSLLAGGASIFSQPDHEVLYGGGAPLTACTPHGCISIYAFEVGNTGTEPQPQLDVRLRSAWLDRALMRPRVRTYGKVDRAFAVRDAEGVRTFALGMVKPGERIEVSFALPVDSTQAPAWDELLVGVDAAKGPVRAGSPSTVTFGRIIYKLFGW